MKVQRHTNNPRVGALYVPARIVEAVPENAHFHPELTEEGILYRFVGLEEPGVAIPSWAKDGASDG